MAVSLRRVASASSAAFRRVNRLYARAFPACERFSLARQAKALGDARYRLCEVRCGREFAGFGSWWNFGKAIHIEFLAVCGKLRRRGLGSAVVRRLLSRFGGKRVWLLAELPSKSRLARRRIGFYERLGFRVNPFRYYARLPAGRRLTFAVLSHGRSVSSREFNEYLRLLKTRPGG